MIGEVTQAPTQISQFDNIPTELLVCIHDKLDEEAKSRFALSCSTFYNATQTKRLVFKLLECIIAGNEIRAQKLLKMRPELAAEITTITDWAG